MDEKPDPKANVNSEQVDDAPDAENVETEFQDVYMEPDAPMVEFPRDADEPGAAVQVPTGEEETDADGNPTGRVKAKRLGAKYRDSKKES